MHCDILFLIFSIYLRIVNRYLHMSFSYNSLDALCFEVELEEDALFWREINLVNNFFVVYDI